MAKTRYLPDGYRAESNEAKFNAVRLPYGMQRDEEDVEAALTVIKPDQPLSLTLRIPSKLMSMSIRMRRVKSWLIILRGMLKPECAWLYNMRLLRSSNV